MRKIVLMLKLNLTMLFNNKLRIRLTILGICIGLLIFAIGTEVINSYSKKQFEKISSFNRNAILINSRKPLELKQMKYKLSKNGCNYSFSYYKTASDIFAYNIKYDNKVLNSNIQVLGTKYNFLDKDFGYCDNDSYFCNKLKLLYGDDFSKEQYETSQKVCILEKSTSKLLFGEEKSLGKYVTFTINEKTYKFKIIGIIDDLPTTAVQNLKINAIIRRNKSAEEVDLKCNVIIPLSCYNKIFGTSERSGYSYIFNIAKDDLSLSKSILRQVDYGTDEFDFYDYDEILLQIEDFINRIQLISDIVILCIIVMSGLIVMNTMFFSVKERIEEIGIRRALGASAWNIMMQIMLESIILAVIASFITIILVTIIFCIYILGINYFIKLHFISHIFIIIIGILESAVFSMIPAYYAAKIKPIDAMTFV